ncbi:hypothetical protein Bbelb_121990 [Branchiostoma belcheri]|nr:hypothetical protein Bbelb_121990 [Branchiostoma belcheri]
MGNKLVCNLCGGGSSTNRCLVYMDSLGQFEGYLTVFGRLNGPELTETRQVWDRCVVTPYVDLRPPGGHMWGETVTGLILEVAGVKTEQIGPEVQHGMWREGGTHDISAAFLFPD